MRKLLFFLVLLFCMACGSTRRATKSADIRHDSTHTRIDSVTTYARYVDTTRTTADVVTITEIMFNDLAGDTTTVAFTGISGRWRALADIDGTFTLTGVKSIKQTTIGRHTEQRGTTSDTAGVTIAKETANVATHDVRTETKAEPAPNPNRWRYIFYLAIVAVVLCLLLKRSKLVQIGKKFAEYFLRIF